MRTVQFLVTTIVKLFPGEGDYTAHNSGDIEKLKRGWKRSFLIVVINFVIFYDGPISEAKTRYNVG